MVVDIERIQRLMELVGNAANLDELKANYDDVAEANDAQLKALYADREQTLSSSKTPKQLKLEIEARCLSMVKNCHDGDELRTTVLERFKPLLAGSAATLDKVASAISDRYAELVGEKGLLSSRTIAKALREVPRAVVPVAAVELTHVGVAETIVREQAGDLRKVMDFEKNDFIRWDGCRWLPFLDSELGTLVGERLKVLKAELAADASLDAKEYRAAVRCLGHSAFNYGVCGALAHQPSAQVRSSELDQHREYLTMSNGAVNILTGELVANRELLLTLPNDCEYIAGAECPTFMRVLEEMFPAKIGDKESEDRRWFELVFGYTMMGTPTEKALFLHKGTGDNGKSMFLNAILQAMGEHATPSPDALVAGSENAKESDDGNGPSPMLHNLKNRRMTYIDEIAEGKVLRDGFVRQIASGLGKLQGRRLGGQLDTFWITVVAHITCNNVPRVRNGQRTVMERLCPVMYTKSIAKDKQDTTLPEKLLAEKAGIFNWLLECARKYLEFKKGGKALKTAMPASARAELEALTKEQSNLQEWIDECCVKAPDGFVNSQDAVVSYNDYMRKFDKESRSTFKSTKGMVARVRTERIPGVFHSEQIVTREVSARQSGFVGIMLKTMPRHVKPTKS